MPSVLKWELLSYVSLHSGVINKILSFGYVYAHRIGNIEEMLLKKFIKYVNSSFDKVMFVYSMNENIEHFISLARLVRAKAVCGGLMLQLLLYTYSSVFLFKESRLTTRMASMQLNTYLRNLFVSIVRADLLKLVQAVSPAPLIESYDLVDLCLRYGVRIIVLTPANAFDGEALKYRNLQEREPIAVYFGRLSPSKGLYDILYVWNHVERTLPNARLLLAGSFASDRVRERFYELRSRLGLKNVEYLGYFKHREELYEWASKAKVLIYPSREDAFPLTVLEAVALGLICVAYSIPALKYIYGDLPSVTLVREEDVEDMSKATVEALEMDYDEYLNIQTDPKLVKFLETYSSWESVAKAELGNVLSYLASGSCRGS